MAQRYEYLLDILNLLGSDMHVWTGDTNVTVGTQVYNPTRIIAGVTVAGGGLLNAESRVTVELFATSDDIRTALLTDPGPARVTLRQLVSEDDGANYVLVPRAFTGRLTSPELDGDRYSVDLVDRYGDPLRPRPRYWSHEDQQRRSAGDMGLKHMRAIEAGVDVRWP